MSAARSSSERLSTEELARGQRTDQFDNATGKFVVVHVDLPVPLRCGYGGPKPLRTPRDAGSAARVANLSARLFQCA